MKENQRAKHQKNRNRKIGKLVKLQINHGTEKKPKKNDWNGKNKRKQTNEQRNETNKQKNKKKEQRKKENKRTKKENKLTKKEMKQKIVRHF